mmetsp:Transcript_19562/g.30633  ORF Transcript_19562/g.30633 Transcript_19562/m.30633 type:complete len:240 (+) Transcript_19562:3-722(+)
MIRGAVSLLFVALCLVLGVCWASEAIEPASGTKFPLKLGDLDLVGTGIRVKKIVFVSVQVYAAGLYVDAKGSSNALRASLGESYDYTKAEPKLFQELLAGHNHIKKALRLVMVRNVGGETMAGALKEAVEPRLMALAEAEGPESVAEAKKALEAFKGQFDMKELPTGTELIFSWPNGNLNTEIAGTQKGKVDSLLLARALFSVFLDENSVVERKDMVATLGSVVANHVKHEQTATGSDE